MMNLLILLSVLKLFAILNMKGRCQSLISPLKVLLLSTEILYLKFSPVPINLILWVYKQIQSQFPNFVLLIIKIIPI